MKFIQGLIKTDENVSVASLYQRSFVSGTLSAIFMVAGIIVIEGNNAVGIISLVSGVWCLVVSEGFWIVACIKNSKGK